MGNCNGKSSNKAIDVNNLEVNLEPNRDVDVDNDSKCDIIEVLSDELLNQIPSPPSNLEEFSTLGSSLMTVFIDSFKLKISITASIEMAMRCLCGLAIFYSKGTDVGVWVETLCRHDTKTLENGISVIRCAHLNVASDQLERIMKKIPRLIKLKEKGDSIYTSESTVFQNLVQTLIHDADLAFHMVETVMKQIRAIQIQSTAIILSNSSYEKDPEMIRIDLGDCLTRLFNIPRVRNDVNAILCGKVNILDSSKNLKARLKSAFLCLIHIEKFNLSHKLPLICNEAIVPFFSIKTILQSEILGDLKEYSVQEKTVIATLMEVERNDPLLLEIIEATDKAKADNEADDKAKADKAKADKEAAHKAKAEANKVDNRGNNSLHLEIQKDKPDISRVKLLLDAGANIHATNKNGWTPLHYAASEGHTAIATLLVDKGADVNVIDNLTGSTPLHFASRGGYIAIATLLVEIGADLNAKDNICGLTPLHMAAEKGHTEVVKLLESKGAKF